MVAFESMSIEDSTDSVLARVLLLAALDAEKVEIRSFGPTRPVQHEYLLLTRKKRLRYGRALRSSFERRGPRWQRQGRARGVRPRGAPEDSRGRPRTRAAREGLRCVIQGGRNKSRWVGMVPPSVLVG